MFCCSCGTAVLPEANYCLECGSRIINQSDEDLENNLPNIIEGYFNRGYQYSAILGLLKNCLGVKTDTHTLINIFPEHRIMLYDVKKICLPSIFQVKLGPNDMKLRLVKRLAVLSLTPSGSISFIIVATTRCAILL
jgi:hypothetical protein